MRRRNDNMFEEELSVWKMIPVGIVLGWLCWFISKKMGAGGQRKNELPVSTEEDIILRDIKEYEQQAMAIFCNDIAKNLARRFELDEEAAAKITGQYPERQKKEFPSFVSLAFCKTAQAYLKSRGVHNAPASSDRKTINQFALPLATKKVFATIEQVILQDDDAERKQRNLDKFNAIKAKPPGSLALSN